jgi:DNA-binding response OmpR family regulator
MQIGGGKMKKTVYIADDEENIRNLMQLFLTNGGYDVKTFSNGDELLKEFMRKPSDLVILDVMMPGTDGMSVCNQIRKISAAFIIIVSARDSELDRITGITLGSDDYLTKPFSPMELVARANALFRRQELSQTPGTVEQYSFGNFLLNTSSRIAEVKGRTLDLTPTEYELMLYLLKNSERAVSREELLKNVWKFEFDVDTRAADDVLKRLRRKLEAAGANFKIESVWGFGFRLAVEGENENN